MAEIFCANGMNRSRDRIQIYLEEQIFSCSLMEKKVQRLVKGRLKVRNSLLIHLESIGFSIST